MDESQWVNNPNHYQCPFSVKDVTCDFFVGMLPFYLGCAFKYVWRAGRKPGEPISRDLRKALECMELWSKVEDNWRALTRGQDYPNQLYLVHAFTELFLVTKGVVSEQWRMCALEYILDGSWASAKSEIKFKIEETNETI